MSGPALLVALNARFSHTGLAARGLCKVLNLAGIPAEFLEGTINQPAGELLREIVARRPSRVLFSCYLWNIPLVRRLGSDLRRLFPTLPILLGGPEVSFDAEERLAAMPWADAVLAGEGEGVIARALSETRPRGVFHADAPCDLDALPFPYDGLPALANRVLYYESTRGCPFGCAYCLSSADRTVRARSLPLVFADLQRFLDARAMRVKLVDRTFNLDAARAYAVWEYLIAHDNGVTGFQMELGGDLLTGSQLALLKTARPGLFQFEIGVQSTHAPTLERICRKTDLPKLRENVLAVRAMGNIHQHLDLIAGLPGEGFARFGRSFDEVFALRPEQLQLGFLKLLRGSALYSRRAEYGIRHSEYPPYEVLCTPELSFEELCGLKAAEEMVEVYYNSGRFSAMLEWVLRACPSAFEAFLALSENMPAGRGVGKYEYYDLLYAFGVSRGSDAERLRWLARYDLMRNERPKRLPACCGGGLPGPWRARLALLALPKDWTVEAFPFDPRFPDGPDAPAAVACDYTRRDALGRARCEVIPLGE